ncbi:TPA: hypothetical protein ACNUTR_003613 [Vibrio cholerae]
MKKTLMQQQVEQCVKELMEAQKALSDTTRTIGEDERQQLHALIHETIDLIEMLA